VLSFAQIGYRGKEQPVGGQSTLDMSLEQAPTMLQEVVAPATPASAAPISPAR